MPKLIPLAVLALLVAAPASIQAQDDSGGSKMQELLQAIHLPRATHESRALGVPDSDLQTIFRSAREENIPAGSLTDLLNEANDSIREHGPVDNFGAFVQERLRAGLRGRELAAAIRAEHAAHGIGKGKSLRAGGPAGPPSSPGKAGEHAGQPGSQGKSGDHGKPDDTGKPAHPDRKGGPR